MFPRMLMKLVSLRTLSSVHSEQVFALRLQDKKLPPLLSEIWDVNEWRQTGCHTLWSLETDVASSRNTDSFLPPSGQGLVMQWDLFFWCGRRASLPFCSQTDWYNVLCSNGKTWTPSCLRAFCSYFCVDADMIMAILNTSIGFFSQFSLIYYLSISSAVSILPLTIIIWAGLGGGFLQTSGLNLHIKVEIVFSCSRAIGGNGHRVKHEHMYCSLYRCFEEVGHLVGIVNWQIVCVRLCPFGVSAEM